MKKKLKIYNILLVVLVLIFALASFFLAREMIKRNKAANYMAALQSEYIPTIPVTAPDTSDENLSGSESDAEDIAVSTMTQTSIANPSIQKLVADYPDVVGWLTVEGADVSHPFVQTKDNETYLWTDLNRKYISGGTLFMDYFNTVDCSDKITFIYGHNMKNGSMFGKLKKYLEFDYLTENSDVYISFPLSTAHYTAAACLVVDSTDNIIFDSIGEKHEIQDVVDYIYANANVNPDVTIDANSTLLVLSTCYYSYGNERTILICVAD